jgi:hypothetical protein
MDKHSFLYLTRAGRQAPDLIAEARGNLPLLWQILLAGGAPAPADDAGQITDEAFPGLTSDADAALLRLRCVVDFMASHPALRTRPALGWAFDGALASLRDALAAQPGRSFSARLDALSWMSDASPTAFIEECRADCNKRWRLVAGAIEARDHVALSRALYLDDPDDWHYWGTSFGFASLSDPYFRGHDTPPDVAHPRAPLPRRNAWWRWFNAS